MAAFGQSPIGEKCKCCEHVYDPENDSNTYDAWRCNECGFWNVKQRG